MSLVGLAHTTHSLLSKTKTKTNKQNKKNNSHQPWHDCTLPSTTYIMPLVSNLQAHRRGILYPHHVLLTLGWYGDKWWRGGENQNLACTAKERESTLNNSLSFIQCDFIEDLNMTTDSGIVSHPPCLPVSKAIT